MTLVYQGHRATSGNESLHWQVTRGDTQLCIESHDVTLMYQGHIREGNAASACDQGGGTASNWVVAVSYVPTCIGNNILYTIAVQLLVRTSFQHGSS